MNRPSARGRLRSLLALAVVVAGLATAVLRAPREGKRFEFAEPHMGTTFRIVLYASDPASAAEAAASAFARVSLLDSLLSDYSADSEIAGLAERAGRPGSTRVSNDLWSLLVTSRAWSERTGGAFDVTVGPLTQLWRWASRRGELPAPDRLAEARAAVGYQGVALDSARHAVRLVRPGMSLDLGGVAKGYAADAALAELAGHGVTEALIDAGGDLVLGAPPPDSEGWKVELPGGQVAMLSGVGVATSGDQYRFVEIAGVRYSHILDPRTGLGLVDAPTVTVLAPDGTTADLLASALSVLSPADGRSLVAEVEGASARVIGPQGWRSATFPLGGPP